MKAVLIFFVVVLFISSSWGCVTDSQCDPGYLCLKNHCICTTCKKEPGPIKPKFSPTCNKFNCPKGFCDDRDVCIGTGKKSISNVVSREPYCDPTKCAGKCVAGICVQQPSLKQTTTEDCGSGCTVEITPIGCADCINDTQCKVCSTDIFGEYYCKEFCIPPE